MILLTANQKSQSSLISRTFKVTMLIIALLTFSQLASAQDILKMRTTALAYKYRSDDGSWSDWSKFQDASVLVIIANDRITVYSKETQVYDVAKNLGKSTDKDGDDFWAYYCVDEEGKACRVRLAKLNSQRGRNQLYIDFNDMKWVYNLHILQ